MKPINKFLLDNDLRIADNPCVSRDFCLDWSDLRTDLEAGDGLTVHEKSCVTTPHGEWTLVENRFGDHAWRLEPTDSEATGLEDLLEQGVQITGAIYFPASYENLIRIKNLFQEADPDCSVFPTAGADLGRSTLGIGARFTTLHWDGVDSGLDLPPTRTASPANSFTTSTKCSPTALTPYPSPSSAPTFPKATKDRAWKA